MRVTEQKAYLYAQRDAFYFGVAVSVIAAILVIKLPAGVAPGKPFRYNGM